MIVFTLACPCLLFVPFVCFLVLWRVVFVWFAFFKSPNWFREMVTQVARATRRACFKMSHGAMFFLSYLINKISPSPLTPFLISRWDFLLTCKNMIWPNQIFFKSLPSSLLWVKSVNLLFFKKMYFLCYHMTCDPSPSQSADPWRGKWLCGTYEL